MALGYRVKVSSKGQIVIPKKLRERLGLEAGEEVDFRLLQGKTIVVEKVVATPFSIVADQIRADLQAKGITRRDVARALREARQEVYDELYGGASKGAAG
jgi:AbrB family looped-hinge helix DNA binding protein